MEDFFENLQKRSQNAWERRSLWEGIWQECYEFALPQREGGFGITTLNKKPSDRLFDGTAPDAVDQLAASMLARLTPPWAKWFGLGAGVDLDEDETKKISPVLEKVTEAMQSHFDRSAFAIEMHQCYLDLVTAGTATLLFEEAPIGEISAFRFCAVPLSEMAFEETADGRLDASFRKYETTAAALAKRFGENALPELIIEKLKKEPDFKLMIVESVLPKTTQGRSGYEYTAFIEDDGGVGLSSDSSDRIIKSGIFASSPFINFRWQKAPGEIYGRSPVMKALPDIKTANKVVELVLKNATIAVTGIWLADDDGVLNPSNIKLVPGAIIPKAVGSKGLSPLEAPGRFDVSELVLTDLRNRINHALLADKLGQVNSPTMTATEVLERSAEMARILGATYGRLQSELLTPLVLRAVSILRRRGEISDVWVDGHLVDIEYRSPLARQQAQQDASNVLSWLTSVAGMGPEAQAVINSAEAARWLGRTLGVPETLIKEDDGNANLAGGLGALAGVGANPAATGGALPNVSENLEKLVSNPEVMAAAGEAVGNLVNQPQTSGMLKNISNTVQQGGK